MLGGMSWESTAVYYRIVNERVRELCGGLRSADCVLRSVDFYVGRLRERHRLDVTVPDAADRADVHRIIYQELCVGTVTAASRDRYREIIAGLVAAGAEGILYGCTEIDLLVGPEDAPVPVFDTTRLHAERVVDIALGRRSVQTVPGR